MKIQLEDLDVGNKVWCGGDSGFCHNSIENVAEIDWKFDEDTGEKYKVVVLSGGRKYDSRSGNPMTPPLAYYLMATDQ